MNLLYFDDLLRQAHRSHDSHIHPPRICHQVSESQRKMRPVTYTLHKRPLPSSQLKEGDCVGQGASRDVREYHDTLSFHLITYTTRINMSISLNIHKKGGSFERHVFWEPVQMRGLLRYHIPRHPLECNLLHLVLTSSDSIATGHTQYQSLGTLTQQCN